MFKQLARWIYVALNVADNFIRAGSAKRALVIGSEVMSRVIDRTDPKTCILFGDGAGAVVLEASKEPGIFSCVVGADGRQKDVLYLKHGNQNTERLQMQGNAVFKLAVNMLDQIAAEVMDSNGFRVVRS